MSIEILERAVALHTEHTSYILYADASGFLRHLYYGSRIPLTHAALQALLPRQVNQNGCSIIADSRQKTICLDDVCLELSTRGKGDLREPMVELQLADGSTTSDFRVKTIRTFRRYPCPEGLPGAYAEVRPEDPVTAVISLKDRNSDVRLELCYSVYPECDCITRYTRVINEGGTPVQVQRLMSAQLDLEQPQLKITSFHGEWAREMQQSEVLLQSGKFVSDTAAGFSSSRANPFAMYSAPRTCEDFGLCYATNLLYSGNHRELAEISGHGKARILTGINPDTFSWTLQAGHSLDAPEAVLTMTEEGYGGISRNMHAFVRQHIVRGYWKNRERPVLVNSWEAMYFQLNEKKLLNLAAAAKNVGIELFVLDDGWFGSRNSDSSSLGDWTDNTEKLPSGLAGLSDRIHRMGLQFGLWVEPEMVSADSDLYRAHPEWAVRIPGKPHAEGRNQMLLDLTQKAVQDFLIDTMTDVFTRSSADYIKWDMNRNVSDYYSQRLPAGRQGEFSHRYMLGLYRVLSVLTERFPKILFEACASGGNRADLGMLCYMPQFWASDCTDALCRGTIQNGYSYGYPQSVLGAHVSGSPNHQTLRTLPLTSRFAIACAGVLGYECNLCDLGRETLNEIRDEITLYQKWRRTLQFGRLYRLTEEAPRTMYDTDQVRWCIVGEDGKQAAGIVLQDRCLPNYTHRRFRTKGLTPDAVYHFYNRALKYDLHRMGDLVNTASPVHIRQDSLAQNLAARVYKLDGETEDCHVSGQVLNCAGVQLAQSYGGTGFETDTALYQDGDARLYFMEQED